MAWGSKYVACAWGHCSAGEVVDDEGPVDALHALNTVKKCNFGAELNLRIPAERLYVKCIFSS